MGQKCVFPKTIVDHLGSTNKCNEPFLSPLQAFLATPQSQNALKMGCFETKNQSKMDQKCVCPRMFLDYLGCKNKWNEPILSNFGPSQGRKCLENGLMWDHKWLKNGSNPWFSKTMILVQLWSPDR